MNRILQRTLSALLLVAAIGLAFLYRDRIDVAALKTGVANAGAAGPPLFMALYALAAVLFLPGSILTLAGGALFGPLWGAFNNLTGTTLGVAPAWMPAGSPTRSWWKERNAAPWTSWRRAPWRRNGFLCSDPG